MRKFRWITAAVLVSATLLGSGCGSKTQDENESQVMQLTITPAPTATPKPVESYPEAAEEKNGITMINQYLVDQQEQGGESVVEPVE